MRATILSARGVLTRTVLALALVSAVGSAVSIGQFRQPSNAYAATCAPVASPGGDANNIPDDFSTIANIDADFDYGRTHDGTGNDNTAGSENCGVPLTLPVNYLSMSVPQQMQTLFNQERIDRGIAPAGCATLPATGCLQLDTTLMGQISAAHSYEMAKYGYFDHPSPINQPPPGGTVCRWLINPIVSSHDAGCGENIAAGYSTAAAAVYGYMYQDSAEAWGHRLNILGNSGGATFGNFDWLGVGFVHATTDPLALHYYYTNDFEQDGNTGTYTPPVTADATPPTLGTITCSGGTAQVTNVADTGSDGTQVKGVTGVVFYINSIVENTANSTFNTVPATQAGSTWSATLTCPTGGQVLHAVAVDGSGNFTDCTATSCSPSAAPVADFHVSHGAIHHGMARFNLRWRLIIRAGVVGFNVDARRMRLNHRLIPTHASSLYRFRVTAPVSRKFSIEVIYRTVAPVFVKPS